MKKCKNIILYSITISLFILSALLMTSCNKEQKPDNSTFKVGVMAGPEADLMRMAVKTAMQKHNTNIEVIEFSDYILPNIALADGSIDINAFQHIVYLDEIMQKNKFEFTIVGYTFLFPLTGYSNKISSIDELPNKAKISMPNDPTNKQRALALLEKYGLIKLTETETGTIKITENKHGYKFIKLDASQLVRALDDVDLAIINSGYAVTGGLTLEKNGIISEDNNSPYVNVIVSRTNNKDDPRIQYIVNAYNDDKIKEYANKLFHGVAIAGWE